MKNRTSFNDFFPTDNSSRTNIKYDLVACKLITGVENYQRKQYYDAQSTSFLFGIIGGIFQIIIGLILILFGLLKSIFNILIK